MSRDSATAARFELRMPVALFSAAHRAEVTAKAEQLEREGTPVLVVCLDAGAHEHELSNADVVHVPLFSAGVAASLAARSLRNPLGIVRATLRLLAGRPGVLRLGAAAQLAQLLPRRGVTSIDSLDPAAARLASIVKELCTLAPPDLSDLPVDWSRLGARRVGLRWFTRRINSIAAEVSLDERPERAVVKAQRSHAAGSAGDRFAHETRVLRSLGEAMPDPALSVPRILLEDEAAALLVMERARGTSLDLLFLGASTPSATAHLREAVRGAGAWLAAMQRATRRGSDPGAVLRDVCATAAADAASVPELRAHEREVVRAMEALRNRLGARDLAVGGHHDDYWPGNIFFDGERVTVIDFESFRDGLPLEDAAFFLMRADLLRRRFRLRFPDLAETFFAGYGEAPDPHALRLFTITTGLRALARGMGQDLALPQRLWTRRAIRNVVLRAARG